MKFEADPMSYIVNARLKTVGLSNFGFFAMEAEMLVSTRRAKKLVGMQQAELERDRLSWLERDDLANDLLEARKLLRYIDRISAPCDSLGDPLFMAKKIDKIYAITAAYFTKENS